MNEIALTKAIEERKTSFGLARLTCIHEGVRFHVSSIEDDIAICWPSEGNQPLVEPLAVPVAELTIDVQNWPWHVDSRDSRRR